MGGTKNSNRMYLIHPRRWGPSGKQLVGQTGQSFGKHVGGAGPQP